MEVRGGPGEGYGRGLKRRMAFGDLVRRLAAGDTHLYLTAQQVGGGGWWWWWWPHLGVGWGCKYQPKLNQTKLN